MIPALSILTAMIACRFQGGGVGDDRPGVLASADA